MRRTPAVLAAILCAAPLLAGCGDDEPTATEPSRDLIEITISEGSVTPSGERVEVGAGEEIELAVKADEPGELHVHSTPEQELEYGAGTTNLTLTIDEPGVVDVEAHGIDEVIVQLEVR